MSRLLQYSQLIALAVLIAVVGALSLLYRGMVVEAMAVLVVVVVVFAVAQMFLARTHRLLRERERERAAQEERIRHQAYHDALTGLPNRASFVEHLEAALRRAKRAGWPLALLFLDLDRFKRVNDSLGHDAGDRLLRIAAERIRRAVREADLLFRMGGDEFIVLLEDVRGGEEAAMVANRMLQAIAEPLLLQQREMAVSASIGIALYPQDEGVGERLLKCADTAMYRAKALGRDRYAFFAAEPDERAIPASASIQPGDSLRQATR